MIENQVVDSLPCFLTSVSKFSKNWKQYWVKKLREKYKDSPEGVATWLPWFRGEDSAEWWTSGTALRPKLYRNTSDSKLILNLEAHMRLEFRRRGVQLITERMPPLNDTRAWYFLMQHYGAPTRLLDWSDAALVGLYFAVSKKGRNGDENANVDAAVYMLDPWWLNEQALKQVSSLALPDSDGDAIQPYLSDDEFDNDQLEVKCPFAIEPPHVARRIAAQRSCFTIFGREKDGLKYIAKSSDAHMVRFDVKKQSILDIRQDLRWAGISEDTIFPDLEGLGRELSYWFYDKCLPLQLATS
jgi:FRG domain